MLAITAARTAVAASGKRCLALETVMVKFKREGIRPRALMSHPLMTPTYTAYFP